MGNNRQQRKGGKKKRKNWYRIKEREGEKQMTVEMEVKQKNGSEIKKKHTQGKRVRKAVWAQEGRISGKSSYHRSEPGTRNCHYSVAKAIRGRGP
jgi:hypothetical protein